MSEVNRPRIVCISGSSRFIEEMAVAAWEFEKEGIIALGCHLLPRWYTEAADHLTEEQGIAEAMDELHLRKIDLADELYVVNVGGYIGQSTAREIAYAQANGKRVLYAEDSQGVAK